jgi:hypothetical protein
MISYWKNILMGLCLVAICACKKEEKPESYKPKFVVEGWIENGDYPYVLLTHNLPFFTTVDSAQLAEIIIRYAKVTVSDGTQEEVLTGMRDDRYFPYFVYRGTSLKGKTGGIYKLKIEYAGNVLEAETSIPKTVPLDSIWFSHRLKDLYQLNVRFQDPPGEKNYYKLYTRFEDVKTFTPTLMSNQDDKYFDGKKVVLQVNRGAESNLTNKYDPYYTYGDQVMIKFSALPQSGFEFWNSFQDEILNSSNPLLGSTAALKTNIRGPGLGIWCGYGSTVYKMTAK